MRAKKHPHKKKTYKAYVAPMIDIWSVLHFMFGIVTSLSGLVLGVPLEAALFITFILAILWEVFERLTGLKESRRNIMTDVALPLLACFVTFFYIARLAPDLEHRTDLLFVVILLYGGLTWISWEARVNHEHGFMS